MSQPPNFPPIMYAPEGPWPGKTCRSKGLVPMLRSPGICTSHHQAKGQMWIPRCLQIRRGILLPAHELLEWRILIFLQRWFGRLQVARLCISIENALVFMFTKLTPWVRIYRYNWYNIIWVEYILDTLTRRVLYIQRVRQTAYSDNLTWYISRYI